MCLWYFVLCIFVSYHKEAQVLYDVDNDSYLDSVTTHDSII